MLGDALEVAVALPSVSEADRRSADGSLRDGALSAVSLGTAVERGGTTTAASG